MKKLVVFSDGTGNSAAKLHKTNVWRLFQAVDQNRRDVLVAYDDGVGTSSNRYLAALGGAFGWGLKRNVLRLYRFVCRNYQPGDEIYGFGFSRGAFTIRVLTGLIAREGLVTFTTEHELNRNAKAAYRHFRSKAFPSKSPIVIGMRWLRDGVLRVKDWLRGHSSYDTLRKAMDDRKRLDVRIRFLGLWDTVEAYGMPVLELKRGIDWVLWPLLFGDLTLSPKVDRACHALSLDDERTTFHPLVWDELAEARMVDEKKVKAGRLTQVWFAGVHANVGGGYPEDQLSLVTLAWMMNQAGANGLPLQREHVERANLEKSPFARMYDARAGLASYYRYSPRNVPTPEYEGKAILPIVHSSVVMRMVHGSDNYAPITLPPHFWVLSPDGALLAMEGFDETLTLDRTKRAWAAAPSIVKAAEDVEAERKELQEAIAVLGRPNAEVVGLVWDTVWYRRFAYLLTASLTALLVAYPFSGNVLGSALYWLIEAIPVIGPHIAGAVRSSYAESDVSSSGLVTPVVEAVAGFLPGYLSSWTNALMRNPITFGSLVAAILCFSYVSAMLQSRIRDRAALAWYAGRIADYLEWARANSRGWRNTTRSAFLISLAVLVGYYFVKADDFAADAGARLTFVEIAVVTLVFFALWMFRVAEEGKYARWARAQFAEKPVGSSFGLKLARSVRTNRVLGALYRAIFKYAVPVLFAIALVLAGVWLANRVLFDAASSAGYFCKLTTAPDAREKLGTRGGFTTDQMCWATGLVLQQGQRYRIRVTTPGDWFDRTHRADVGGIPPEGFGHWFGVPLRRWWNEFYFKPVARVGSVGNHEYVLTPAVALAEYPYCRFPERYGKEGAVTNAEGTRDSKDVERRACATCEKVAAQTEGDDIGAKIAKPSAEALLACSPTPEGRKELIAEITPKASGELFLYVNDAVWMIPGKVDVFYRNNTGSASITVERVSAGQ